MGEKKGGVMAARTHMRLLLAITWIALVFIAALWADRAYLAERQVPRMAKEQLLGLLGTPDTVILDVRQQGDWEESRSKIAGAVRVNPHELPGTLLKRFPKEKTLVFYCS
jgi:hypothetical protein